MTEREALPYEDLGAWLTDDLFPGWARYWNEAPAAPPKPPWYHNSRVLLTMIAVAAAALVVATVLLLILDSPGFNQTEPLRSISPPTTAEAIPATETAAPTPLPATASETAPETAPETAAAADPAASAEQSPPPTAQRSAGSDRSDGPRINVTRTPMSFTPAPVARP